MKSSSSRSSTLLGAALLCGSVLACGDNGGKIDTTPDAGPDAHVEPLTPGIAMITDLERAVDITRDGRTALLWKQSNGEIYYYDVASGGLETKTTLDITELQNQQPHAMSDVGHIVAGYGVAPEAASRWDATNGWVKLKSPLDPCPNGPPIENMTGGAHGVSPDGKAVVGLLWDSTCRTQAFLWKDSGGEGTMIPLQKVGRGTYINERASVISDDGKVAAGFAPDIIDGIYENDRAPAMWKDDGTGFLLDPGQAGSGPGEIKAISADGKIVAGDWATADPNWAAFGLRSGFTWSEETGVVRFSSATPSYEDVFANAMSADGTFVYGIVKHFIDPTDFFSPYEVYAYVWSKDKGLRNLQEVATSAGIAVPADHHLMNVQAVSSDGRVVLGSAGVGAWDPYAGVYESVKLFVLVLPEGAL